MVKRVCEIQCLMSFINDQKFLKLNPNLIRIHVRSANLLHFVGRRGYKNTYQGGETSQGKIISIKCYFTILIFEIIYSMVGSGKYLDEISKPQLLYIK